MLIFDRKGPGSSPARVLLFSKFLELEFYLFRNYERNHDLSHFWSKKIVLSLVIEYALQISFTPSNSFIENSGHWTCRHVKIEILWQAYSYSMTDIKLDISVW